MSSVRLLQHHHLTAQDIQRIVTMHRREIGQGFLSSLGDRPLGLIYSLAAEGEAGILIAAKAPVAPVGVREKVR